MRISELQDKDVINLNDGKKIGNIIDLNIDNFGKTLDIVVETSSLFSNLFSGKVIEIKWDNIEKIGKDVILVNIE